MKILHLLPCLLSAGLVLVSLHAEGPVSSDQRKSPLIGNWVAQFETPTGTQRYVYEFTGASDWLGGVARWERANQRGETPLQDIKLAGDAVSFTENLSANGRETKVTYTGTLGGDELRLTRSAGDLAVEAIVAHRMVPSRPVGPKPSPEKEKGH